MAHRGIREYDAKRLISKGLPDFSDGKFKLEGKQVLIGPETDIEKLPEKHPWLKTNDLVAKPDQLFGKRGKNRLIVHR